MLLELTRHLKAPHLYGMVAELAEKGAERARKPEAPEVWLQRLVDAKSEDRQAHSMRYQQIRQLASAAASWRRHAT